MDEKSYDTSSEKDVKVTEADTDTADAKKQEIPAEETKKMDGDTVVILPEADVSWEPSEEPKKKTSKQRTVPFFAFVASLLAVLLVCSMFTVAIASATRRLGFNEGVQAVLGPGGDSEGTGGNGPSDTLEDFSELEFLDSFFKTYSYNDLSDADFLTAVLKAYVEASGDLYAEYYTKEEYEAMIADANGEGVGIGISVIYSEVEISGTKYTAMEVVTAFPDSPAMKAGVEPGDLVMYVGIGDRRELVQTIGYTEALSRMRGEKGSLAEFTVLRPQKDGSYEELEFSITRDEYTMQSVEYKVSETDPTVGIVRILQFDLTTPEQLTAAMDDLTSKGIGRFVFDVRNNPGGDLKSICAVLSYFLEEGDLIISAVDRNGQKEEIFAEPENYSGDYAGCSIKKSDIGKYRGYEMAVLTNGNTASAAELFTATMRDYELATIVGTTTYGKGSMQSIYPLLYWGYEGAIKLTTRHYFPPCGEGYDGIGITPNVEVELSEEAASVNIYKLPEADDNQLQAALSEFGRADEK